MKPFSPDKFLSLGPEGEKEMALLANAVQMGSGFLLLFAMSDSPLVLKEVNHRLNSQGSSNARLVTLEYNEDEQDATAADDLIEIGKSGESESAVWINMSGIEVSDRSAWKATLAALNAKRNEVMRKFRHPLILAGPKWLGALAADIAPDLWSVRSHTFTFPIPPVDSRDVIAAASLDSKDAIITLHDDGKEKPAEFYLDLANELKDSDKESDRKARAGLLRKAGMASSRESDFSSAIENMTEALDVFRSIGDKHQTAASLSDLALLLRHIGNKAEALEKAHEAVDLYEVQARKNPDAFIPDLSKSYSVLSNCQKQSGGNKAALESIVQAISTLKPLFLSLPKAFKDLMSALIQQYSECRENIGSEPDVEFLAEIVAKLTEKTSDTED